MKKRKRYPRMTVTASVPRRIHIGLGVYIMPARIGKLLASIARWGWGDIDNL